MIETQLSTGIPGLDSVLKGILPGDNLVWQVDSIGDYALVAEPYCQFARRSGRRLVYFRFADHEPLVPDGVAEVCVLRPGDGFEQFITRIHEVVKAVGRGAFFLFDCLSTLAEAWSSDRMLGNFFMLTCPYVYDQESIAYFATWRDAHSFHATTPIAETTQILIDVYRHKGELYLHPIKVQHRYSPTIFTLHAWEDGEFSPVTESSTTSEILTARPRAGMESVRIRLGVWNRRFLQAEEIWDTLQAGSCHGSCPEDRAGRAFKTLLRMAVTRDERVLRLAEKHLTLGDLLAVWKRMIGTGLIGGKSVGMLLARAILKKANPRWERLLEAHDSFYIGSDVFYTFLVENGCWWLRQRQRDPERFLDGLEEARRRLLMGAFPDYVRKEFAEMLDYFGQSPIIVRSSSLLEDNFGNAFAGKYESVFCANQGPHEKRLQDFMSAVKTIYASTMSEKALRYRAQRGILDRDEQMSLLVQRVSGKRYGSLFYPQVAGVGLSFNPYVWSKYIDPASGVVRLVFGLGTRAVDRSDDDYTRVVALNAPQRRPETDFDEVCQYSQRKVDLIDLEANQLVSYRFPEVARRSPGLPVETFASRERRAGSRELDDSAMFLTFDHLLSETSFVSDIREMLHTLHDAYDYAVDVEFTANFFAKDDYKINLVQCRPLQVAFGKAATALPERIAEDDLILEAQGAVIGQSRTETLDWIIYVEPSVYAHLGMSDRYGVARLVGRILHHDEVRGRQVLLVGPGRWGTTTPSLGVPVSFAEIDTVSAMCEIVAMREDLVPDVSLGTHFFNELVEMDILYLALFPGRKGNGWNEGFFRGATNCLAELAADVAGWSDAVRVIRLPGDDGRPVKLNANALEQRVVCYREPA